ncbi:hypothetical protein [Aureivirga marina]|uniref:hypothetical protein n=1 Tax=Aureivirga marina TaxID=1182451 RepID=UPI0018CAED0C|nr:hypothetical protein [Aureivirga marina]
MKKILTILFLCFMIKGYSQKFPLVKSPVDSLDTGKKSTSFYIKAENEDKKVAPSTPFKAPQFEKNIDENTISDYTVEKSDKNFMNQYERDNRGVKTINYFQGEEYGTKKTKQYLGKYTVNTKRVSIVFRDFGLVDGDQIKVFLNDNPKSQHVNLKGHLISLILELEEGHNKINIQALNQGRLGPNTAEMRVYDENGFLITTKSWALLNKEVATMVIHKN